MYQENRRTTADDVVADPDPLELQVLRVAGALHLPGVAPERDGGGEDHRHNYKQNYQYDAHSRHDNAKMSPQDTGATRGGAPLTLAIGVVRPVPPSRSRTAHRGREARVARSHAARRPAWFDLLPRGDLRCRKGPKRPCRSY